MRTRKKSPAASNRWGSVARNWVAVLMLVALGMLAGSTGAVWSQPDCDTECDDHWHFSLWFDTCTVDYPYDCTHCTVTCPGDGGGEGCETPHCGPFDDNP